MLLVEDRLCKCGCGGLVTSNRMATVYIHGHNTKGKNISESHRAALLRSNLGKPKSAECREKIRSSKTGVPVHTEESKRRIGAGSRLNWENGLFRTEELKQKRSETVAKVWASGNRKENPIPHNVKHPSHGSPTMYNGQLFRSKIESRVAKIMDEYGVLWIYEPERLKLSESTYKPDFYLPEFDTWLEVKWDENGPGLNKPFELRESGERVVVVMNTEVSHLEKHACCD